jgi:hypothetical protein
MPTRPHDDHEDFRARADRLCGRAEGAKAAGRGGADGGAAPRGQGGPSAIRLCGCGCGERLTGRPNRLYLNEVHKQRAWRRTHGAGSPQRSARQREAGSISRWILFELPREMESMLGGPPVIEAGQRAIEDQLAHVFGRERTNAGFDNWLVRGWVTRRRNPDPPPARSVPTFTLTHTSEFGCSTRPPGYWSTPVSCDCGSTGWVRGGKCWDCRQTVTEAVEGKVGNVIEAPTIVARISKLERDTALIMEQLGLVGDDDARAMVEDCLAEFGTWETDSDIESQAA